MGARKGAPIMLSALDNKPEFHVVLSRLPRSSGWGCPRRRWSSLTCP